MIAAGILLNRTKLQLPPETDPPFNLEKFKLLDCAQRESVRRYIQHIANSPACPISQKETALALAHWSTPAH